MASPSNGGIIGKSNKTSFAGACEPVTSITASGAGSFTTKSGTRLINSLVIAGGGGGGGGASRSGGGGAGGLRNLIDVPVCGSTSYSAVVGAGGTSPTSETVGVNGTDSSLTAGGTTYTSTGGGGGGGGGSSPGKTNGGSGIVYLRFPSAVTVAVSPGTNTINPAPGCTQIAKFTVSGTNTVTVS